MDAGSWVVVRLQLRAVPSKRAHGLEARELVVIGGNVTEHAILKGLEPDGLAYTSCAAHHGDIRVQGGPVAVGREERPRLRVYCVRVGRRGERSL
jgi:hypothetical protein